MIGARTIRVAVALACGVLFAFGLAIAGMTEPAAVIAFLDVGGRWNPSLALVIVAAIAVFLPAVRLSRRRGRPLCAERFDPPARGAIDVRLLGGAALFGLGWGASGYCPGPAVASVGRGGTGIVTFLGAMLIGMLAVRLAGDRTKT